MRGARTVRAIPAVAIVGTLLAALAPAIAAAKSFYITVERSYGTAEAPVVDVAFARREPVELRVLQPEDLDAFLDRQSNVRRAYDAPDVKSNPGRALARGLDAVRSPGTWLYRALAPDVRTALAPALPPREPASTPPKRLRDGPERVVGLPPGMRVVRREWLNLDLGGADRAFDVPGFKASWWRRAEFEQRRVTLPRLPAGVYVLQLVQGRVEGQVVLVVSDLRVQVKQTDDEVLVRVARADLQPRPGVRVALRTRAGRGPTGTTDRKGEVRLTTKDSKLLVVARDGQDVALVDTDFYSTLAVMPDVFVYSDRPIYRPGDELRFRGVARAPEAFLSRVLTPAQRTVQLRLLTHEGREVATSAPLDDFGSFSGTLAVPPDAAAGVVRLVATIDAAPHQAEARVDEYVKPTFYVEIEAESEAVRPGEALSARIRARRYAGGPPKGTRYEVFLHRALVDAPAWIDDAGLGAQGSAVTYGSVSTTEGKLSVPERLYSSVLERAQQLGARAGDDPWASAPELDANGEAEVRIMVPPLAPGEERYPWRYTLTVRARDDQGTFANGTRPWFLTSSELVAALQPAAPVVKAGAPTRLALRATSLSGRPLPAIGGRIEYVLRTASGEEERIGGADVRTAEDGTWRGSVPAARAGVVLARVELLDRAGHPWRGEASIVVVGPHGEEAVRTPALTLASLGGPLAPGAQAELAVLLPARWGANGREKGKLWITLSGQRIHETRVVQVSGFSHVHRFPVERRFGSAVYASVAYPTATGRWEERTAAFRIVPPERTLRVAIAPERAEAAPLGAQSLELQVTDHQGRPVVAEVSVGVVDRAVYAVQGELRPRILDFFYPLGRENVATFTSAEFQGYGYGEALARALRQPGYAFAAVKPPARTRETDTAYWNPSVVTDRDGRARVAFTLPSNQTLWTVTAVAADAAGRFGEGTAEFASRGALQIVVSAPQFLRAGDEAEGSVRVARSASAPGSELSLRVGLTGAVEGVAREERLEVSPGAERIVPLRLRADRAGPARLALGVSGAADPLQDRREIPVREASVEEKVVAAAAGGGRLALDVPPGAEVAEVQLALHPSTVAVALASVEDLLTYPYGCLEQLVATSIPNIALARLLERTGAVERLDPASADLLSRARSLSAQGIQRILALAHPDGGFTWFHGMPPSAPLTIIALDGLAHAADAGLVARDDPRLRDAARWVADQPLPLSLQATRAWVLARLDAPRQAAAARALLERVEASPADPYTVAMALLAAHTAGVLGEPGQRARADALLARTRDALARPAALDQDAFFHYPLRRAGYTAVLSHAASLGVIDVAVARRRFIESLSDPVALTTFERSTAILHTLWLLERDARALRVGGPPTVQLESGAKARLVPRSAGFVASLPPGTRAVRVAAFDGNAELRAIVRVPLADARSRVAGMSVTRSYHVIREGGLHRLAPGDTVAQGEEVFVALAVDAHEKSRGTSLRSAYYVVEDAVPAGFTVLGEDKAWRGAPHHLPLAHEAMKRRSFTPERATFYFEEPAWWSRSPRVFGYVLRAQFPGRFAAPPATIEDMYAPRIRGQSDPAVLEIRASGAPR